MGKDRLDCQKPDEIGMYANYLQQRLKDGGRQDAGSLVSQLATIFIKAEAGTFYKKKSVSNRNGKNTGEYYFTCEGLSVIKNSYTISHFFRKFRYKI